MLRTEYFEAFTEEFRFLTDYHTQFNAIPNKATFLTQFPDFPFEDTENTAQWIADEVAQDFVGNKLRKEISELEDAIDVNPREAAKSIYELAQKFMPYISGGVGEAVNLLDPRLRLDEIERRRKISGLSGVTMGFDVIDAVCNGTQPGEIEIIFARPGQGKTLYLLWGAYAAIQQGKRVTLISPEMGAFEMGLRLDAYSLHQSQSTTLSGKMDDDEMSEFLRRIVDHSADISKLNPLLFREPSQIGRKFTTADVAQVIKVDQPDIVCIDGLMLIDPTRVDKDPRKRIINLMEELKELVVNTGVPIRLAHQANRESELGNVKRMRGVTIDDALPRLAHMAESGSTEQYANRAIAVTRLRDRMYLAIRKNRNGPNDLLFSAQHNIDRGRFTDGRVETADDDLSTALSDDHHGQPAVGKKVPF